MRPDRRLGNGRPRTDSGGFTPVTPTMGAFLAWATPHQTSRPASHTVSIQQFYRCYISKQLMLSCPVSSF